jgi:hypothetical protein
VAGWSLDLTGLRGVLAEIGTDREALTVAEPLSATAADQVRSSTSGPVAAAADRAMSARAHTIAKLVASTDRAVSAAIEVAAAITDGDEEMARTASAAAATVPTTGAAFRLTPSRSAVPPMLQRPR